jgi:hypothetical protein
VSDRAEKLNKLMELLAGASPEGGTLTELYPAITSRKNKEHALEFSRTEFHERIVFVPQCLRSTEKCAAEERAAEYVCRRCRACKIADVVDRADELGYMGVRILKGGSAVSRLLDDLKPKAVLGVACNFEGALGMLECERLGIAVQTVILLEDGCADTDVDLDEVMETMEFRQPGSGEQ